MTPLAWMLLAVVVIGNTAGQLMLKAASVRADRVSRGEADIGHWKALLSDPLLWLGLSIYGAEFFLWLAFLTVVPLWLGVMIACIDIPLVMVGGRIFFREHITGPRIVAITLIAAGVLLIGLGGTAGGGA